MLNLFEEKAFSTKAIDQDELAVANGVGIIIAVVVVFAAATPAE